VHIDNQNAGFTISSVSNEKLFFKISNLTSHSDSSIIVEVDSELMNGEYVIYIPIIKDIYSNPTVSDSVQFAVAFSTQTELYLTSLQYIPPRTLIVTFSEAIDNATSVLQTNNYSIFPFGDIDKIDVVDSITIQMQLSTNNEIRGRGWDYLLTAKSNIYANTGNQMTTSAGNTLGFVLVEDNINLAYVYPAPISLSKHNSAYFGHLPSKCVIEIMNHRGLLIRTINVSTGNGGIE